HVVLPPYTGNFMPSKPDLVLADEHVVSESITSLPNIVKNEVKTSETTLKNVSAPIIEDWVSDSEDEDEIEIESNQIKPSFPKKGESPKLLKIISPSLKRFFLPKAVLADEHVVSESITSLPNIVKNEVKTSETTLKNVSAPIIEDWVSDSEDEDEIEIESNQIKPSFPKGKRENAVKSSACWIWRTRRNVIDHITKESGSYMLKRFYYVDLQGRLKHLTGKKSFLTDYQEFDGEFVAFGRSPKRSPNIDFMKPFGCHVTILNTLDHLVKFERKADGRFLVGYSINRRGLEWLFDIDSLTICMNYEPVTTGNQTNHDAGIKIHDNAGHAGQEKAFNHEYILLSFIPLCTQSSDDKDVDEVPGKGDKGVSKGSRCDDQDKTDRSTKDVNTARPSINTANTNINTGSLNINTVGPNVWKPKKVLQALADPSWIEAMQEEFLQFKLQKFEDPHFPKKVYKVEKALYGLHQAPRAWYETLSTYLLENGFRRGTIDKTLFIKTNRDDAQEIPNEFYGGTHFLLRLQVKQKNDGIFISQDKYVADILKKFDFSLVKTAITPIETHKALLKDEEAQDVDVHLYRSMIRSLMYLTASRPDIMFAICACARFYVTPKTSHLHAVKRIFR
nr:hypothetical protein [Tanacetum cinerariifolium]